MKLTFIVIYLICFALILPVSAQEPEGFRGLTWGQKLSIGFPFKLKYKDGTKTFYENINENLNIGDAKIDEIVYVCFNDKFSEVVIIGSEGFENYDSLKSVFIEKYGVPEMSGSTEKVLEWNWDNAYALLKYNKISDKVAAFIRTKRFDKQENESKKRSAKRAAEKDL